MYANKKAYICRNQYTNTMRKLYLLPLLCLLLGACSDDKDEQPIFVTNVTMPNADTIFKPGDAVTIKAEGFLEDDQLIFEIRWPLPDEPIQEGYSLGEHAVITERTATSITFLAPGHYPASTVTILLDRASEYMSLGKISVSDGQSPKEPQLYGITNSRSTAIHPYGIERINLTNGQATKVVELSKGQDFSLAACPSGRWRLCGILKQGDEYSTSYFDLSINYWKNTRIGRSVTLCVSDVNLLAVKQADEKHIILDNISDTFYTRNSPIPTPPLFQLPDGMKPEDLSCYPGVYDIQGGVLLSADNGNGTFSPVVLNPLSHEHNIEVYDPIQATALIPFWMVVPVKDTGTTKYMRVGGYAIAKESGTELCLFDTPTMTLKEPFATLPGQAISIAPLMQDTKAQLLYVLFKTNQGERSIGKYDLLKKEWEQLPNSGFPYAEIVLTK